MKVVVAYKWARNPQDATVNATGEVARDRAGYSIREYDPVAIELGRRLADASGGEVVGLTAGPGAAGTAMARKAALSRGLDRLVVVADDALEGPTTTRLAAVLAAAVRHIGNVDVVITGDWTSARRCCRRSWPACSGGPPSRRSQPCPGRCGN